MVVYDPSSNQYVSFIGPVTNPSENQVQITDAVNGMSLTFAVTAASDGGVLIDLGDQGNAVLAQCDINEVLTAIKNIGTYGSAVA